MADVTQPTNKALSEADVSDNFCAQCGHRETWHTKKVITPEWYMLAAVLSWLPTPGHTCELCNCSGFVRKMVVFTKRRPRKAQ